MKIVISESQHLRLLNLLNEGPVPAVIRRLNQLRASTTTAQKIIDPLDDIIQTGRKIEIDLGSGSMKELKDGDEVLEAFLGSKLNDADHRIVTQIIFKETDDQTLINAIAKSMVDSEESLRVTYRQNPATFLNSMKNFYGQKQADALVDYIRKGSIAKISSELSTTLDDLLRQQRCRDSIQDLIDSGALQSSVTQVDDLIILLKNGDLSSSDKKKVLEDLFKFTDEQKQIDIFARELMAQNGDNYKNTFKTEIDNARVGLKTGESIVYQTSINKVADNLKTRLGLTSSQADDQARTLANAILRPGAWDSFKLGWSAQSGLNPVYRMAFGPIIRSFKRWENYRKATKEEKEIFLTWLVGAPSNWPAAWRIMKSWGWLRGIPLALSAVGGQLARKWFTIWYTITVIDAAMQLYAGYTTEEKEIIDNDETLQTQLLYWIWGEIADIIDPENGRFMMPIKTIWDGIVRYVNPGAGGGLTRLKRDLDARWGTQLAKVKEQIMQTEGLGLNVGNDSTEVKTDSAQTVKKSPEEMEKLKKYLDSLNNPIKGDTTSTPKVTIKSGN